MTVPSGGTSHHVSKYSIPYTSFLTVIRNCCFWQLSCGIHVSSSVLFSLTTTNLYSEIKIDDSPVKGSKRGKGKKKKMAEPTEKKKPKLEELKVLSTRYN